MRFSVLIPYRRAPGRERAYFYTLSWWGRHFPAVQLCIGNSEGEDFNRSEARNNAFRLADKEVLVVADADTVPNVEAVTMAVDLVAAGDAPWVLPYGLGRYYNLSMETTEDIYREKPETVQEPWTAIQWEHKLDSVAGCLVMRRGHFKALGGYDPRFTGWGGEDVAFAHALDVVVGPHARCDSYICHLWHPVALQTTFDGPQWAANGSLQRHYLNARSPREVLDVRSL